MVSVSGMERCTFDDDGMKHVMIICETVTIVC